MSPSPDLLLAALTETQRDAAIADEALETVARAFADFALWQDPSLLDDARRALRQAGYNA